MCQNAFSKYWCPFSSQVSRCGLQASVFSKAPQIIFIFSQCWEQLLYRKIYKYAAKSGDIYIIPWLEGLTYIWKVIDRVSSLSIRLFRLEGIAAWRGARCEGSKNIFPDICGTNGCGNFQNDMFPDCRRFIHLGQCATSAFGGLGELFT